MDSKYKKLFLITFSLVLAIILSGSVSAAADIQVNQNVNNTSPNYKDTVKYTTTVTNNGPDTATGVQVTTKLPESLIYISDDSNGAYNPSTGIWTIGTFTYGDAPKSLNIIARVNNTGTIINLAEKTAQTNADSRLDNNAQQAVIKVPKAVDISVNQYLWFTPSTGVFDAGNLPVFVVDVRNGGINDATNVTIRYDIGSGYKYVSCDTRGNGYTTLVTDGNGKVTAILWTIPYMPAGVPGILDGFGGMAFMNVYLRPINSGSNTPELTNTAKLMNVDQYDTNPNNNQASASTKIKSSHDMQIDQNYTINGNYITYIINATNNGPDDATGVQVKDKLSELLQLSSWTSTQGTYYPDTGIWDLGNVTKGTTKTLTITAEIISSGTIKNTAAITTPLDWTFGDWNYNNNSQTTIIGTYTPNNNIAVYQYLWASPSSGVFDASNTPTFVVDVRNIGIDDAQNVVVRYDIGSGYRYIGCDTRGNGYTTLVTDGNGKVTAILWTIPYMPAGVPGILDGFGGMAFMNVFLFATDSGNKPPQLTNIATVTSQPSQPKASASASVKQSADVQLTQTITGTTRYNDTITITINATNNGPNDSTGLNIKDKLPTGLQYITYTASAGTYDPDTGTWNIGTLSNKTTATLTITAKIISTGTIKNTAAITTPLDWTFGDWNYNNNSQTRMIEVNSAADIGVTQNISNITPTVNDNVTITVNATNYGPDYATGIGITDLLPSGLQLVSYNTLYGTFSNGIWTINNLANGGLATLTITAKAVNVGNYTNTAAKTAENEYDWNPSNDSQSVGLAISGLIPKDTFTNEGQIGGTVNTDDGTTSAITLPFPITFYGQNYTTIYINVNGLISFGQPMPGPYFRAYPDNVPYIAAFWGDIDITYKGSISYTISGDAVTVTWTNVPGYTKTNDYNNFKIIIKNNGTFGFVYGNMEWKNDPEYLYSRVIINSGAGSNPTKEFWNGSQNLNKLRNKSIWFDSNGNSIPAP